MKALPQALFINHKPPPLNKLKFLAPFGDLISTAAEPPVRVTATGSSVGMEMPGKHPRLLRFYTCSFWIVILWKNKKKKQNKQTAKKGEGVFPCVLCSYLAAAPRGICNVLMFRLKD